MAQNYNINCFDVDEDGQSDLQKMENNFECLRSNFLGLTEPSMKSANTPWFDSSKKLLKIRNTADSAWLGVMCGDSNQKTFVYKSSASDGWLIDGSVSDCLLALKSSSGAYSVAGGSLSNSSWQIPTQNLPHSHKWLNHASNAHDTTYQSDGSTTQYSGNIHASGMGIVTVSQYIATTYQKCATTSYTDTNDLVVNYGNSWRPLAAVGTLQYPNI